MDPNTVLVIPALPQRVLDEVEDCDNCSKTRLSLVVHCESCNQQLCCSCEILRHQNTKKAFHTRVRKKSQWFHRNQNEQINAFQSIAFGIPRSLIESAEFIVCADKPFSTKQLTEAYRLCRENPDQSLLKVILAEIRETCHLKSDFHSVLCQTTDVGPIALANVNDFIICLLDACKETWQKNNIAESLMYFDQPIILGHNNCSIGKADHREAYGLHLDELYHLMNSTTAENDANKSWMLNVLSVGTSGTQNKTKLLNEIWKTKFEEWTPTRGLHHNGLLELHIADETNKRKQHLLDLHGNNYNPVLLNKLGDVCDLIVIHCLALDCDFIQNSVSEELSSLLSAMEASNRCQKVVLIVQGLATDSFPSVEHAENALRSIVSLKINNVDVFALSPYWQEKQNLLKMHTRINNMLSGLTMRRTPLANLYNSLKQEDEEDPDNVNQINAHHEYDKLRQKTKSVLGNNEASRLDWFPLSKNSIELAALDDKHFETMTNHDAIRVKQDELKRLRTATISGPVEFFRDFILRKDLGEAAIAIGIFQQELQCQFKPHVETQRKMLKLLKEEYIKTPTEKIKNEIKETIDNLISFDIASVHFIRELIERSKDKFDDKAEEAAIIVSQNELLMGRSIEIVNGDSLTIATRILQDILQPVLQAINGEQATQVAQGDDKEQLSVHRLIKFFNKIAHIIQQPIPNNNPNSVQPIKQSEFVSITVIGIESSGKSTLWNELWNTNFPVAHGKCSRGLWSAFVQVKGGPSLLVNDTEGILSPLCDKPRFDQKLVLLSFALSHIVIINVHGGGSKVLIDLLKLIIYAAHKLSCFHRPQIVFVHRDVMGAKQHQQGSFKNILMAQLHEACEAMGTDSDGLQIKLENIIDIENIHSYDLPSAINEPRVLMAGMEVDKEERTEEFVIRCRELRSTLVTLCREIVLDKSKQFSQGLGGEDGWIPFAQKMWDLARQNASLWTFASVNDMLQRRYIERELYNLLQKHAIELQQKAAIQINSILDEYNKESAKDLMCFPTFLTEIQNECLTTLDKEINELVGAYKGPPIPLDVAEEYKVKAKTDVESAIEEQKFLLLKTQRNQRLEKHIKMKITEVQEKMDDLKDKNFTKEEIEKQFDSFLTSGIKEIQEMHNESNAFDKQMQGVRAYTKFGSMLNHPFTTEFINTTFRRREFQQTAQMMTNACKQNISSKFDTLITRARTTTNDQVFLCPDWAYGTMRFFRKTSKKTIVAFSKLQQFVYHFLWVDNFKHIKESDINEQNEESIGMQSVIQKLCNSIDEVFVRELVQLGQKRHSPFSKSAFRQTGYIATLINLYHAFACNMLYYYLGFKYETEKINEIERFKENCIKRKKEFVLRAQCAKSAESAAAETVQLILESVKKHTVDQASAKIATILYQWNVDSKTLVTEAMESTFRAGNFDEAFEFITKPVFYLKKLCFTRFQRQYNKVRTQIDEEYFTSESHSKLCENLDRVANIAIEWGKDIGGLKIDEAVTKLFRSFLLDGHGYLTEIANSVSTFLKNPKNNSAEIDPERFYKLLVNYLTNYDDLLHNNKVETFTIPLNEMINIFEHVWPVCRGCESECPYCGQKCSGNVKGHTKHFCDQHLLQAYNGWHDSITQNANLHICTEPNNFNMKYHVDEKDRSGDRSKDWIPYAEHLRRYHENWNIVPADKNAEDIHDTEKIAWIVLRDRLGEHFEYKIATPPEWEILYRERATRMVGHKS